MGKLLAEEVYNRIMDRIKYNRDYWREALMCACLKASETANGQYRNLEMVIAEGSNGSYIYRIQANPDLISLPAELTSNHLSTYADAFAQFYSGYPFHVDLRFYPKDFEDAEFYLARNTPQSDLLEPIKLPLLEVPEPIAAAPEPLPPKSTPDPWAEDNEQSESSAVPPSASGFLARKMALRELTRRVGPGWSERSLRRKVANNVPFHWVEGVHYRRQHNGIAELHLDNVLQELDRAQER